MMVCLRMVTHLSTNPAQRRVTSLKCPMMLPLSQTAIIVILGCEKYCIIYGQFVLVFSILSSGTHILYGLVVCVYAVQCSVFTSGSLTVVTCKIKHLQNICRNV